MRRKTGAAGAWPLPCLGKGGAAMAHTAYLLACAGMNFYAGYTPDITRRVLLHETGRGAKYTRRTGRCALCTQRNMPPKARPCAVRRR